jgi:hypothetical protein
MMSMVRAIHARAQDLLRACDEEIARDACDFQKVRLRMKIVKTLTDMSLTDLQVDDLRFILDTLDGKKCYPRRTAFVTYTWEE